MQDQADELRQMVRDQIAHGQQPGDSLAYRTELQPRSILRKVVVSAGKRRVGTTTVAVNLAVSLARQGCRTILVDADRSAADSTRLCGLESTRPRVDALSSGRTVAELLCAGPVGIQVIPGGWAANGSNDGTLGNCRDILRHIDQLACDADLAVIDIGGDLNPMFKPFWHAADSVVLVTTVEASSVMNAYAAIKVFLAELPPVAVQTVVNQCRDDAEATAVHARLAQAARRFLGLSLGQAEILPWDGAIQLAAAACRPFLAGDMESPAAMKINRLAERLMVATEPAERRFGSSAGRAIPVLPKIDPRAIA